MNSRTMAEPCTYQGVPQSPMMRALYLTGFFLLSCGTAPPRSISLAEIAAGQAVTVDLSYPLNKVSPHWPGEGYSAFRFQVIATLEADGVYSGAFSMPEHLGTHIDAPNHFEAGGPAVDEIQLQHLIAPLVVVDIQKACLANPDYRLSLDDLESWESRHVPIPTGAVVFAFTGWGRFWNDSDRYKNQDAEGRMHFPGFSEQATRFLVSDRAVKGIGIDTLSVDFGLSERFAVHHIVNGAGAYLIENAASLSQLPALGAWMIAAPIKIENGSGGPARIWAVFTPPAHQK